jgi:hypothetical protein
VIGIAVALSIGMLLRERAGNGGIEYSSGKD